MNTIGFETNNLQTLFKRLYIVTHPIKKIKRTLQYTLRANFTSNSLLVNKYIHFQGYQK